MPNIIIPAVPLTSIAQSAQQAMSIDAQTKKYPVIRIKPSFIQVGSSIQTAYEQVRISLIDENGIESAPKPLGEIALNRLAHYMSWALLSAVKQSTPGFSKVGDEFVLDVRAMRHKPPVAAVNQPVSVAQADRVNVGTSPDTLAVKGRSSLTISSVSFDDIYPFSHSQQAGVISPAGLGSSDVSHSIPTSVDPSHGMADLPCVDAAKDDEPHSPPSSAFTDQLTPTVSNRLTHQRVVEAGHVSKKRRLSQSADTDVITPRLRSSMSSSSRKSPVSNKTDSSVSTTISASMESSTAEQSDEPPSSSTSSTHHSTGKTYHDDPVLCWYGDMTQGTDLVGTVYNKTHDYWMHGLIRNFQPKNCVVEFHDGTRLTVTPKSRAKLVFSRMLCEFTDIKSYAGEIKGLVPHGFGEVTYDDGTTYLVQCENGHPIRMLDQSGVKQMYDANVHRLLREYCDVAGELSTTGCEKHVTSESSEVDSHGNRVRWSHAEEQELLSVIEESMTKRRRVQWDTVSEKIPNRGLPALRNRYYQKLQSQLQEKASDDWDSFSGRNDPEWTAPITTATSGSKERIQPKRHGQAASL